MDELHTLALAVAYRIVESGENSEHTEVARALLKEARSRETAPQRESTPAPSPSSQMLARLPQA
jgi:hypothetical protein